MQLDNELIIETPEHVELRFALAGVGTRFLAAVIDHSLQALLILLASILLFTASDLATKLFGSATGKWVMAVWILLATGFLLFVVGYFTFFETIWSGQTPGKRWMQLRVIREDGRAVGFFEAFVRNALRIVDYLPSGYAIGVVTVIFSDESRRLGDYVAGTVVVKERASEAPSLFEVLEHHDREIRAQATAVQSPFRLDVRSLTEDEVAAVETFLNRRADLPTPTRARAAMRITLPLLSKLAVPNPGAYPNYEVFLEDVDRQYRAQAKYLVD